MLVVGVVRCIPKPPTWLSMWAAATTNKEAEAEAEEAEQEAKQEAAEETA